MFQVQQDDGLPQIVCVRCLGTLEFLCDFYDRCHHTQKELSSNNENIKERINVFHVENEIESDKENALPPLKKCYRSSDSEKSSNSEANQSNFHSIEDLNNFVIIKSSNIKEGKEVNDKKDCTNVLKSEKSLLVKEETYLKPNVISSTNLKKEKNVLGGLCKKRNATITENSDSKITIYRKKESRKATLRGKKLASRQAHSSAMKKAERKNWFNNRSLIDSTNIIKKSVKETKTNYSRVIPAYNNSSTTKTETLSFFDNIDSYKTSNVINNQSIICASKAEESSATRASILSDVIHDVNTNKLDKTKVDVEKRDNISTKLKCDLGKSDITVLKKEHSENTTSHAIQVLQSNQFVWIPNNTLLQEPHKPKFEKDETLSNTSPPPGDEAGPDQQVDTNSTANHTNISTSSVSDFIQKECFSGQVQTEISKSSVKTIVPEIINEQSTEIQLPVEKEKNNSNENTIIKVQKSMFKGNFNKQKSKEGGFGKISELISDEQKLEIEKYYKVDMSVVDSKAVLKNLTVVDKKNIRCNICGMLYPRMDKCQVHIWGHLKMRPYKCTACEFSTVTVSNVRCHIRKSHLKIKPFACHLCEKRYVTAVLLQEHLNTHTGARPFKCKICDFASSSRQVLSYHNTTHKPVKDIHCKVCGKEFYSRGRMRAHMLIHNKDKVVTCKLCSAYLSNATALEQHMKNIHTRDYICNVCGKNLKSRKTLLNHKNVHAAAKYKCDLCPNVYKSSHILKEHLLKHEGIRKYKCNVCEKSFAQQSHLAAHMAVHSEIRYHCPGCNKAFNRQDNMKIHTKRCDLFLSNPELKNLLKNKERAKYVRKSNNPATVNTSSNKEKSNDSLNSKSIEKTVFEATSISKDANEQEYRINQENISQCGDSEVESVQNDKTMKSIEKMIALPTESDNDICVTMHENNIVIENILSSDCF
ncbi:hypothetical protein KPH14_001739 [Odynerus spinipes]|uniref:C2H2-type domain-containing protein n=1 Tax=Odynerus spinipes TaxID=1348599 RepID=A0AAD9VVZ5_9HYME|nr:hypothetical protein KPH14_001739 [Odynerus spinipes]